jgi:hydrogenase-4 component E
LQGVLLAFTTALVAHVLNFPHLYISAALSLGLKGILIPIMLQRLVVRLGLHRDMETLPNPARVMMGGTGLVVFSYYVCLPIVKLSPLITLNTIAISMAVVLLGMLLMITRRQAVAHVVGFMSIENGLFFAAVVSTYGMPMVVELGIAFDVLVAAVLFGVFFFHIRSSIDSLDVDQLNKLSEAEK